METYNNSIDVNNSPAPPANLIDLCKFSESDSNPYYRDIGSSPCIPVPIHRDASLGANLYPQDFGYEYLYGLHRNRTMIYWTDLGRQLEELQNAYANILELSQSFAVLPVAAEKVFIGPAGPCSWPETFEEQQAFFNSSQESVVVDQRPKLLRWVFASTFIARLIKCLSERIQEIKRILYCEGRRFCGLTWSKRVWAILHGNHPPKPESWREARQAFGCV